MSIRLLLAYDGTRFFGWQKTRFGQSVQEMLEKAVFAATGEKVSCEAASRTDRGVHARGQVAAFSLERIWEERRLLAALNAHLPEEIRVLQVETALLDFHPTLDAKGKEYHYHLSLGLFQFPMDILYAWHVKKKVDVHLMRQGAAHFIGTRDFSAFTNEVNSNPICTVTSLEIFEEARETWKIAICGDRFLYKMVRNLVGTLVYVGAGLLSQEKISTIFESKDRKKAGVTAPAHGLFLHQVVY